MKMMGYVFLINYFELFIGIIRDAPKFDSLLTLEMLKIAKFLGWSLFFQLNCCFKNYCCKVFCGSKLIKKVKAKIVSAQKKRKISLKISDHLPGRQFINFQQMFRKFSGFNT
jgi:hypothetical protein